MKTKGIQATERRKRHLHPFPARMAPELALEAIESLSEGSVVLDPMCGSGTVLRQAASRGFASYGFDVDPLAVLMSRVSGRRLRASTIVRAAEEVLDLAAQTEEAVVSWMDEDGETSAFADFWFAADQRKALRQIASVLAQRRGPTSDALRIALSKTIVTKDRGASLARDISHSRPHRVRTENDYDVFRGFRRAASQVAELVSVAPAPTPSVALGDARHLPKRLTSSIDLAITSPPYLNAIDYLRGHRLALVWLGYTLGELRHIRGTSIGAERAADREPPNGLVPNYPDLPRRQELMLNRYANDCLAAMTQLELVLKPGARAVVVVGDSTLKGTFIENSEIARAAAEHAGLVLRSRSERVLPAGSRYLPPPASSGSALALRMRSEVVLDFQKPGRTEPVT